MYRKKLLIFLLFLFFSGCASVDKPGVSQQSPIGILEPFKKNERVLILAPHPDDEAISCAGIIQEALKAQAKVRIVYLTNGDHNELAFIVYERRITLRQGEFVHMGQVRQQESIKAMEFLGLSKDDLIFLGYPDSGTFEIFCKYWQSKKPFRDRLTRISSVPYKSDHSYGAPYYGESILNDLTKQIWDYKPDKIFVSHPADVNGDHKTLYLFLQVALSDLEGKIPRPKVYPYLVHCVGWPKPRHYHPELELSPPEEFIGSEVDWLNFDLRPKELAKKYQTILFYKSQTQSAAFYLLSFARKNELFSDYPVLELKPQPTLKNKIISYSGASGMFKEARYLPPLGETQEIEEKGFVSYGRQDDYFIVRVDKPKKLSSRFGVMLYIFGYSKNITFAQMPKICVITSADKCKVFNAQDRVIDHGVLLDFGKNSLVLKIPFKLLGEPDYLLTSLKAYHGNLPIDAVGYRKIKIK